MAAQRTEANQIRDAFNQIMTEQGASSRSKAVNFLNSINSVEPEGVDALISGAKMPDIDIKLSSALTLGRVGFDSPEVLAVLQEVLEEDQNNPYIRHAAACALAQLGSPESAAALTSSIKKLGLKNEDDRIFWSLALQEFACLGGLGLPHLGIFDDLRKDFELAGIKEGSSLILSARREFSRSLEGDFRRFVAKYNYQSQTLDDFVDDSGYLIEVPEFIPGLDSHTLVFDERVTFDINSWSRGPITLKADVRLVVLNSNSLLKRPTVIISRDELTQMSLFMDADDIAQYFVKRLNKHLDDFHWVAHSSPGRDNSRLNGTINSIRFDPNILISNTVDTEESFGKSLGPIMAYLRNNLNPPQGFYDFVVAFRQNLARRARGH